MRVSLRLGPCILSLFIAPLCAPRGAVANEAYLCAQLDRIRAEETMPAIGAGLILPNGRYPQSSSQRFTTITCASGVERYDSSVKVKSNTQFGIASVTKPLTGLVLARVIADEATKPNPKLTWNTRLVDFFPHIARIRSANRCYDQRTVADLMSHVSGMPNVPAAEPSDQWESVEPDVTKRRERYVNAAVLDAPVVECFDSDGDPLPQLTPSYAGGVIIAAHMAEIVTGRSWEDLMRRPGNTSTGPGLRTGTFPDPAIAPYPYAYGHTYSSQGIPIVGGAPRAASTNGPAGNIVPTLTQLANVFTEFLDATEDDPNRQLPDADRALLYLPHELSNFNHLGWNVGAFDSSYYGNVAKWNPSVSLYHNGSSGAMYAAVHLVPHQNAGMFSVVTADGPHDANGDLTLDNRPETMKKVFAELTALRLHHGEAANIVHKREPTQVTVNGASTDAIKALADGRLTTKWTAPTTSQYTVTLSYQGPTVLNRIVIAEDVRQQITRYELSYQDSSDAWHLIFANEAHQDLIFPHRIFKRSAQTPTGEVSSTQGSFTAKKLRLRIMSSSAPPELVEFAGAYIPNPTPMPTTSQPQWEHKGFAEENIYRGPLIDPGPYEPAPAIDVIRTIDPGFTFDGSIRTDIATKTKAIGQ